MCALVEVMFYLHSTYFVFALSSLVKNIQTLTKIPKKPAHLIRSSSISVNLTCDWKITAAQKAAVPGTVFLLMSIGSWLSG